MLETIGYDAAVAASFAPWRAADASVGRVVRVDRGVVAVLTEHGADQVTLGGALLSELAEDVSGTPCAGDWVVVRTWPDGPHTLERVLPRRTVVPGPMAGPGRAANVDVVVLLPGPRQLTPGPASDGGPEVLPVEPDAPGGLDPVRERLAAGGTVALLGPAHVVASVLDRLVGATPLGGRLPGAELVLVPGGGAVVPLAAAAGGRSQGSPRAARPVS